MVAAQRIRAANLVLGDVQCAQIYECGGEDVEIKRDVLREALIDLIEKNTDRLIEEFKLGREQKEAA